VVVPDGTATDPLKPLADELPIMERVSHDGRETAYRIVRADGDGPTVLYVHGSGGTHRVWAHQYAPSGPAHPAVALDLSGHGESTDVDTDPGPGTLRAYAADVCAVARVTGASVLVGNSLGGAVVLAILRDDLLDPAAVVLAGTGAKLAVHESLRTQLRGDFPGAVEMLHDDGLLATADPRLNEESRTQLRETGREVTLRDFLTCHQFDVRDCLGDLPTPALAVVGDEDSLTPPSSHEYLAAHLPDCELTVLSDAAHLAMLDRPAAFNDALAAFFDRRGLR